jgi:hypothetical protein
MPPMAMQAPSPSVPAITIHERSRRLAWALWIIASIGASILGALAAWQIQSLDRTRSQSSQELFSFATAVVSALILSGGQWLVLRHYRLDAYWWIPVTVAASVAEALLLGPAVMSLAVGTGILRAASADTLLSYTVVALATSGLVVGGAQAIVLRSARSTFAWAWIPATILGGAAAGVATTALSNPLLSAVWLGMPVIGLIIVLAGVAGLASSTFQAAILARVMR